MNSPSETSKRWAWAGGLFLVVAVLVAGTCGAVLLSPDRVLAFNDGNVEAMLSPVYSYPGALVRIWDNQVFFGLGGRQVPISFTSLGEVTGAVFWRRWGPAVALGLCALAFFWAMRQYRFRRPVAAVASAILAFSGVCHTFAVSGLVLRPISMACAALALGFIERGRLGGGWVPYALAGGCVGLGITEVPDVGAFYALVVAGVFWWTHLAAEPAAEAGRVGARPGLVARLPGMVGRFILLVVLSGLLAYQTIGTMFATQIKGVTQGSSESADQRYAWATQWSIPPAEMWNALTGDYFGQSIRSADSPYWGRVGRDAGWDTTHQGFRNFSMSSWHIGIVPGVLMLAMAVLTFRRRKDDEGDALLPPRTWFWLVLVAAVLCMLLMWGRHFPLYRLFWSLPYFGTIRNPEKWNGPFTLFVGLGVATMLEALWRSITGAGGKRQAAAVDVWKVFLWTAVGMTGVALLVGVGTLASHSGFVAARLAEGYENQAEMMWNNAVAASFKAFLLAGATAGIAFWGLRRVKGGGDLHPGVLIGALAALGLGDQFLDNRGYVESHAYRHNLAANPLTDHLDAHRTEGRIRILPQQHPLLNNLRMTMLMARGYDLFDPPSVSRMPTDYAALFQAFDRQPFRLWEIGALRYCLTLPGAVEQLNTADGNRGRFVERLALGFVQVEDGQVPAVTMDPRQQILRLVEFTGALPKQRFASSIRLAAPDEGGDRRILARMGADDYQAAAETWLQAEVPAAELGTSADGRITVVEERPVAVRLEVERPSDGWLVRGVKFDADWKVTIDGRPAPLVRADYLFQAVRVPAGRHDVRFDYRPSLGTTWWSWISRLALIFAVSAWTLGNRRRAFPLRA